ncbi:type I restriction endonuclease [Anatilimnocola sp. NA78]|uniref:type I restriction endonuclease n=1 Tax=Anatilimnocola sp. NA78 TaxID=3415683 RepID=UPI003CE573A3
MFCKLADLVTESDVEQKLVFPMLNTPAPTGLGYATVDIRTKPNIKKLLIDKGKSEKLYHPDYVILIAGIPLMIVEVKNPDEDCHAAYREARLYANEVNAKLGKGVNPCSRIIVTNGKILLYGSHDTAKAELELTFNDINVTSVGYNKLLEECSRPKLQFDADHYRSQISSRPFHRALNLLGGQSLRDEEVGQNTFGRKLAIDYNSVFVPETAQEREYIVENAYVTTRRREHYVDEVDRVIKRAANAFLKFGKRIEDTESPVEVLDVLREGRNLEGKVMLVVGPRGAGKSTFVDYCKFVKLSVKLKAATIWVRLDLSKSPPERNLLESYLLRGMIDGLKKCQPELDFDERNVIESVFSVELRQLRKGALADLDPNSTEYKVRIADKIIALQKDLVAHAQAMCRYLCGERSRLLIIVFDNCDKGDLEQQLLCFQVAKWLQDDIARCLLIMPIRDITYDAYKDVPPLDTHIKDLVFRIEPPPFSRVLGQRIKLVLNDLSQQSSKTKTLDFTLDNKYKVTYPANELGIYLASIYKSLYEYDRLIRSLLLGLAGNDLRKAMEIFLEFCKSGHIGASEYWKMKAEKGHYTLPYFVVTRVLLRRARRFYDGDSSFLANIFQCDPQDAEPDTFVRLAILNWLEARSKIKGPTSVVGFFPVYDLVADLVTLGHDAIVTFRETGYLVLHGAILTEHQRPELKSDSDLIRISPSGYTHLQMSSEPTYLAACAEDSWVESRELAETIKQRIGQFGPKMHFSPETNLLNAKDFISYLTQRATKEKSMSEDIIATLSHDARDQVQGTAARIESAYEKYQVKKGDNRIEEKFPAGHECLGTVSGTENYGVFVDVDNGPTGLIYFKSLPNGVTIKQFRKRMRVKVKVDHVEPEIRKLSLRFVDFVK